MWFEHDDTILSASGIPEFLEQNPMTLLGDGLFYEKTYERVYQPWTGPQIWPRIKVGEKFQERGSAPPNTKAKYLAQGLERMQSNAVHQLFRSHVEHAFGNRGMGGFFQQKWAGNHLWLKWLFSIE